ncbi:hypothetical protein SUGI_0003920 [Cryptomeria japonica]|nr:hypothetical protein SUGI_0003920 [Cryptomeria japonica]
MAQEDVIKYVHSPVHSAVVRRDYDALRRIIAGLPRLVKAGEVKTEAQSIAEEQRADAISAVIDRRDVPGRETALHLAVRLGDATAAEMLMAAGADWSLQNEQGWSALQEAVCAREEAIAMIIMRHYQPLAWAKWCRRLPRLVATMRRMRDFYMEITFHFESSVIPFIGRIAPSDTYKIWKRGSNLRADMTLAGFDGFRIQRSDQSFLFLGDGSEDGRIPPGSLCMLSHKDKEIMNALDGAGSQPSEVEIAQEVAAMSQTNMYRPGIDVTQAELIPQVNWRRQERTEMVGPWKAKIYDMHHVMVSVKSRRVPGAMTDDELIAASSEDIETEREELEDYDGLLTEEEKRQLETALKMDHVEIGEDIDTGHRRSCYGREEFFLEEERSSDSFNASKQNGNTEVKGIKEEKKGWFTWGKRNGKQENGKKTMVPPRNSLSVDGKVSDLLGDSNSRNMKKNGRISPERGRRSVDVRPTDYKLEDYRKGKEKDSRKSVSIDATARRRRMATINDIGHENEYKKGLRPILWLTPQFPLRTDELLPLLDILANKVKAIRRLRELLTTKLPSGTFPVKIAIPVVPTIRVIVTFTKFEELQPEEFCTPPTSPENMQDMKMKDGDAAQQPANSWFQWIKGPYNRGSGVSLSPESCPEEVQDPFVIPRDYTWTTIDAKKKRRKEKKPKSKKGRRATLNDTAENEGEK